LGLRTVKTDVTSQFYTKHLVRTVTTSPKDLVRTNATFYTKHLVRTVTAALKDLEGPSPKVLMRTLTTSPKDLVTIETTSPKNLVKTVITSQFYTKDLAVSSHFSKL